MKEKKGVELAEAVTSGEIGNSTTRGRRKKSKSPHANIAYGAPGSTTTSGRTSSPRFSMMKRKFRDGLRSKTDVAMVNEVLCTVLCHNLAVLIHETHELGIDLVFWSKVA